MTTFYHYIQAITASLQCVLKHWLPALLATVFLAACGGDGKDSSSTETENEGVLRLSLDELTPTEGSNDASMSDDIADAADEEMPKTRASRLPDTDVTNADLEDVKMPAPRKGIIKGTRNNDRIRINLSGRLADLFNDSNKYQLEHAERLGIAPITSLNNAFHPRRPMVKVTSNKFYTVDSLTHSLPYLVPEAERLLRKIGANFIDSLGSRGADGYRIIVTSLLRTPASVKKLRRVNVNATEQSTHQFGTTFDLTYTRFQCIDSTRTINQEDLKNLLGEVLLDLRERNECMVKFERKTGCYHITVTR